MEKIFDLKRDWLVLSICIITLVANLYFYSVAQSKIDLAVDNCNKYWQQQIKGKYAVNSLLSEDTSYYDNISYTPEPMPGVGGK